MNAHVETYVECCRGFGLKPPQKLVAHLMREVRKLMGEGHSDEQIGLGVRLLADKGSSPTILPWLLVEAVRKNERRLISEFVNEYGWPTGVWLTRGSHGAQHVYHPLGTARAPAEWPHARPDREEVERSLKALEAIGSFLVWGGSVGRLD